MMRAVMEAAGLTFWPLLSLGFFTLAVLGLLAWLYRSGSADFYGRMAEMAVQRPDADAERIGNGSHG